VLFGSGPRISNSKVTLFVPTRGTRTPICRRSPAFFGERLEIGVRVPRVGTKSVTFEFEIRGPDGRLVAEASSVHVTFDYDRREPIEVPEAWRERIEAHEAERLAPR